MQPCRYTRHRPQAERVWLHYANIAGQGGRSRRGEIPDDSSGADAQPGGVRPNDVGRGGCAGRQAPPRAVHLCCGADYWYSPHQLGSPGTVHN